MARLSTGAANAALDGIGTAGYLAYVALFTADPTTSGASGEVTGGGYARQACTWNAAASGAKTNSTSLTWSTPGVTAVPYFGTFSAVTAGNYGIGGAFASSVTAASITAAAGALSIGAS